MTEDPRRSIVEVMARLGRETQFHIDERHRHFKITDAVIIGISLLLVVLAVVNIYYVRVLYKDLDGTVVTMEAMYRKLRDVDDDMKIITEYFGTFEAHMQYMEPMDANITALARTLPPMRGSMVEMATDMASIDSEMGLVQQAMVNMDQRMGQMGGGITIMRANSWQMAKPMGMMNSIMP
jgi:phosphoribulokinase